MWVVHQATVAETCEAAEITKRTLQRWRDYGAWDKERETAVRGFAAVNSALLRDMTKLSEELAKLAPGDPEAINANALAMSRVLGNMERIRKMERDVDYKRMALAWTRGLIEHLRTQDPAALKTLQKHLRAYTVEIARA